jgi:hypothetical protein
MKLILGLLVYLPIITFAQSPFCTDSALYYLRTISVDIGPRPMGSPNERRAMEFALAKFREFGLSEAYIMEMRRAENDISEAAINTNSGVAVGILQGRTNRIIVIGGHIDSASPFIPGANDDGSGSATVIELARVLSKGAHESTIVFCLFGGEESGVCGSNHFVNHFPQINNVALMISIDMANGSELLIPTIDNKDGNTPIWLVQATYEEFAKLKYSGLKYLTHFFTAMSLLPGGGVGSDHDPFLKKGIPAIDFTSDMNDPIHTPQDDIGHFKPIGLKRSGDLVKALIHRFDSGVPDTKTNKYYLLQIGKHAFFIPIWLLTALTIISFACGIVALYTVRKRRIEIDKKQRPTVPALKLFLFAIIIQSFVWLSANLVGIIKGVRFPWISEPDGYFLLGLLSGLLGIAVSLLLTKRIRISKDPYRWYLRTFIFLTLFVGLFLLANIKIAFYPAVALLFIALAMLVQRPWLRLLFWFLSPHFMFYLIFSEGFLFFSRSIALNAPGGIGINVTLHAVYIIFFAIWSFPFLLGFAAIYFDSGADLLWLKHWKSKSVIIGIFVLCVVCILILIYQPSYSDEWRQNITIEQSLDLNSGKGSVWLKSSEYLDGLNVHLADLDTTISTKEYEVPIKEFTFERKPWITLDRTMSSISDSNTTFSMLVKIHFQYRPRSFTLSYSNSKNSISNCAGEFITSQTDHSITMRWESFPDTALSIPIQFTVIKGDSVTENIEARFVEMVEPVRVAKELINVNPRTIIKRSEVLKRTPTADSTLMQ